MVTIRRAQHSDAEAIINAHVRSIRETCSRDYSPEQIEAWAGRNFKTHLWHQTMDRDFVWVVELDGRVLGFGQLALMNAEHAEVMGLYFTPELQGKGAGVKLLSILKEEARVHGIKKLTLFATITAKSFYLAQGCVQVPGDLSIGIGGIQIPCFPMECPL